MTTNASLLTADHFAVILGFEPENPVSAPPALFPFGLQFPEGHEIERHGRLKMFVSSFANDVPEPQQDRVYSQFCARYLPATVNKFLDLPPATDSLGPDEADLLQEYEASNAYLEILIQVQHLPYLYKYLRSNKEVAEPGKRLTPVLAERIAARVDRWDAMLQRWEHRDMDRAGFYNSAAGCAIQLLNTLCSYQIRADDRTSIIESATQQRMLPVLTRWAVRYNG
ncbi:MYND-type domain-containing protein [Mycena chlorophos]|uniref:MYND-type domain-containing protein n=1 Tax=Mycena chlorophos TaxID=658473 RepID=A0A8H6W793_MYCCL|nr:MYND-type domain-containing protein [Mycena chlorophos]